MGECGCWCGHTPPEKNAENMEFFSTLLPQLVGLPRRRKIFGQFEVFILVLFVIDKNFDPSPTYLRIMKCSSIIRPANGT